MADTVGKRLETSCAQDCRVTELHRIGRTNKKTEMWPTYASFDACGTIARAAAGGPATLQAGERT
jgi:hypothetical protein